MRPIAFISTPYKEKFAIPRQPGLVKSAIGEITFEAEFADANCLRDLDSFSHIWLIFQFHQNAQQGWQPLVRPPRLGGNQKTGVFATRSGFRPNGLGLSVVELVNVDCQGKHPIVQVRGMDLLDQTPIYDIKPYIPYSDSIANAQAGFAQQSPATMPVTFSALAEQQMGTIAPQHALTRDLICDILQYDARPAYHSDDQQRIYGMQLYDWNIRWRVVDGVNEVLDIALND